MSAAPETGLALLKRVAASHQAEPDFAALVDRVRVYLAGADDGLTLDAAFGLAAGPGEHRERRNRELRAMVARFYVAGGSVRARALWLQVKIGQYAANAWPRDRAAVQMPRHYQGTEKEHLFRAFIACEPPFGERQLREILSDAESWQ